MLRSKQKIKTVEISSMGILFIEIQCITKTSIVNALECGEF